MRDLKCRGASFPFSFQRRGFWLGNFVAASGRREQLAKLVPPGGTGATQQACSQGQPWRRMPCPCVLRLFFHQQLSLGTNTRASYHQQENTRVHPRPTYLFTVIPTESPLSPKTPRLHVACNRPNPNPEPWNPITLIAHALLCHFQPNQESCIGQANPNAAMQTSPTIRYLERKKIYPAV